MLKFVLIYQLFNIFIRSCMKLILKKKYLLGGTPYTKRNSKSLIQDQKCFGPKLPLPGPGPRSKIGPVSDPVCARARPIKRVAIRVFDSSRMRRTINTSSSPHLFQSLRFRLLRSSILRLILVPGFLVTFPPTP